MGIEGYSSWLKHIVPSAFTPQIASSKSVASRFDRIYVDFNGFLHRSSYRCITDDQLIFESHRSLQCHLDFSLGMPLRELYIAMDGGASVLKMKLQRERRRDIALDFERRGGFGIDCQKFTPGCMFMGHLESSLVEKINQAQGVNGYRVPRIIIDGASRQGEGELKIIQEAMRHPTSSQCIISLDSDPLLHGLLSGLTQLVIFNPQQNFFFSVDEAKRVFKEEYGIEVGRLFGLMSNFMGNDFTPRLRFGSIKILFTELVELFGRKSEENEDILNVLPLLAEKYVKGLTASELGLYESSLKKYSCSDKEEREWNLSHYLYLNQWIINSMYQKDHPDDIQMPPAIPPSSTRDVGPCIGDCLSLDIGRVREKIAQIEDLNRDTGYIKKIPAAVGMTLINPISSSVLFLPKPIQSLCKKIDSEIWNDDDNCKSLLKYYTDQIESIPSDEFTEVEHRTSFPQELKVISLNSGIRSKIPKLRKINIPPSI
jgi:hypothetical protein